MEPLSLPEHQRVRLMLEERPTPEPKPLNERRVELQWRLGKLAPMRASEWLLMARNWWRMGKS